MAEIKQYDVLVNGAGVSGLCLALGLAQVGFSVALVDPKPLKKTIKESYDLRVRAMNQASIKLFKQLSLWPQINEQRIALFDTVNVWQGSGAVTYRASEQGLQSLGAIIEEQVLLAVCAEAVSDNNIQYYETKASDIKFFEDSVCCHLENAGWVSADVLVGADGAHSWVRQAAGIQQKTKPYGQSAIVATIKTEKPHDHCARQRFLETGPLAFLPLADPHHCSIVWSLNSDVFEDYFSCEASEFESRLNQVFENNLGALSLVSQRLSFPLKQSLAADFVKPHVALISDAAHTMHPLAGLGLNLGLSDVAELLSVFINAKKQNYPIGDDNILLQYQRARLLPVKKLQTTMMAFKTLFGLNDATLNYMLNRGLKFVDAQPLLKRWLSAQAIF